MENNQIAVVTGANRGIGFETARQLAKSGFKVILTSRHENKGKKVVDKLRRENPDIDYFKLDITDKENISNLVTYIKKKYSRLDVLVNNAGIYLDGSYQSSSIFSVDINTIRQTLETNLYGAILVSQALIPVMKLNNYGRIINVSSGMGQLTDMYGGSPAYRISKTSLNAVTRMMSSELSGTNITVNSICPGWVKTDMGGANAQRTPEQAADTIVWLAGNEDNNLTGKFFRDRKQIPW